MDGFKTSAFLKGSKKYLTRNPAKCDYVFTLTVLEGKNGKCYGSSTESSKSTVKHISV